MDQVKCPDCGEKYSENMQSCPNCGCPNDNWKPNQKRQVLMDSKEHAVSSGMKKHYIAFFIIICMLVVCFCSFLIGFSLKSNPKQTAMPVDSTLIKKAIKDSLDEIHKVALQKQEEEKQEEDRERQARQEEERKRIGRDIDITLNAYFDGMRFHNIESNYGVYESRFYHQLKSQLITIPKGKIWVFKGFDIDGRVEEAIVGKSDGDGFISSTDRYDLKNHEAFTIMGGTSIRILLVVYSRPQQITSVCHFKEKDMDDL